MPQKKPDAPTLESVAEHFSAVCNLCHEETLEAYTSARALIEARDAAIRRDERDRIPSDEEKRAVAKRWHEIRGTDEEAARFMRNLASIAPSEVVRVALGEGADRIERLSKSRRDERERAMVEGARKALEEQHRRETGIWIAFSDDDAREILGLDGDG